MSKNQDFQKLLYAQKLGKRPEEASEVAVFILSITDPSSERFNEMFGQGLGNFITPLEFQESLIELARGIQVGYDEFRTSMTQFWILDRFQMRDLNMPNTNICYIPSLYFCDGYGRTEEIKDALLITREMIAETCIHQRTGKKDSATSHMQNLTAFGTFRALGYEECMHAWQSKVKHVDLITKFQKGLITSEEVRKIFEAEVTEYMAKPDLRIRLGVDQIERK